MAEFEALVEILKRFPEAVDEGLLAPALTEEEVQSFESRGWRLPHVLRAFYLMHNGMGSEALRGSPHNEITPIQSLGEVSGALWNTLHNHAEEIKDERKLKKSELALSEPEPENSLFAIGMDASGDVYFLDLRKRSAQGLPVFRLHHDAAFEVDDVADSIEEFIFEFLSRELGSPAERPRMPHLKRSPKTPAELVEEALAPAREAKASSTESYPQFPILSEIGSTAWISGGYAEGEGAGVHSGFFTPQGDIVTLGRDGRVFEWNMEDGSVTRFLENPETEPTVILLSPNGKTMALYGTHSYDSDEGFIALFDFAEFKEICRFEVEAAAEIQFTPDSLEIAILTQKAVVIFECKNGNQTTQISLKKEAPKHFAISADGLIATHVDEFFPVIIRDRSGKKIHEIAAPEEGAQVQRLIFRRDGRLCIASTKLHSFNPVNKELSSHPLPFEKYETTWSDGEVMSLVEFRYEKYSCTGYNAAIVDLTSGQILGSFTSDYSWRDAIVHVSPARNQAAVITLRNPHVELRSLPDGNITNPYNGIISDANLGAVTSQGYLMLSGLTISFLSQTGSVISTLKDEKHKFELAAVSPDGAIAMVTCENKAGRVVSLPDLKVLQEFKLPSNAKVLQFGRSGTIVLFGCDNAELLLYNLEKKKSTRMPEMLSAYMSGVALSPDEKLGLAADGMGAVLFDVEKRSMITKKISQGEFTWVVDFSPDGSRFLVAGRDVSLRVFSIDGKEMLRIAEVDTDRAWILPDNRFLIYQMNGELHLRDQKGTIVAGFNLEGSQDTILGTALNAERTEICVKSIRGKLFRCSIPPASSMQQI